jgi:hypothetical protein
LFIFLDNERDFRSWFYGLTMVINTIPIRNFVSQHSNDYIPIIDNDQETINIPKLYTESEIVVLKSQLNTLLQENNTFIRFFYIYWKSRQAKYMSHPTIIEPCISPPTPITCPANERPFVLPIYYLSFWLDALAWSQLSNKHPPISKTSSRIGYRAARAQQIIDLYFSHGAPYPVYTPVNIYNHMIGSCSRQRDLPSCLFGKAMEVVLEIIAVEIFPRYLRSKR